MKFPFVSRSQHEQLQERLDGLQQEFKTYRRRNENLEASARFSGGCDAFRQLLPVYDNLRRALDQPCSDEAFVKGIRMTMESLQATMERMGIEEIPALGCTFDPNLHEAMDHIEDPELGENVVAEVVLTGFRRGDTILRHALVVAAN